MISKQSTEAFSEVPRSRLLLGRGVAASNAIPAWLELSYKRFHESVIDPTYPCYFGTAAEKRGELYYTFACTETYDLMPATLENFLVSSETAPDERRNLTIFFEPDYSPYTHAEYRRRFWKFLGFLHSNDPSPWPAGVPTNTDDPNWEFAFAGRMVFVFCATPSHERRASRNLGPGMIVLMQPRTSFVGIEGNTRAGIAARNKTRERIRGWDRTSPHPDLGVFGEKDNREWKQYFLPDDNRAVTGTCPLHRLVKRMV